jgi:hypothetical protein
MVLVVPALAVIAACGFDILCVLSRAISHGKRIGSETLRPPDKGKSKRSAV